MSRDSLKHRAAIRGLLDDVAAEMKFAVQDIRQEVVERGWFGRETTPEFTQSVDHLTKAEAALAGPQDHSNAAQREPWREDLYGREPDRDVDRDEQERDR